MIVAHQHANGIGHLGAALAAGINALTRNPSDWQRAGDLPAETFDSFADADKSVSSCGLGCGAWAVIVHVDGDAVRARVDGDGDLGAGVWRTTLVSASWAIR